MSFQERDNIKKLFGHLEASPQYLFPKARVRLLAPKTQGVYVIRKSGQVMHVGRTHRGKGGLYQRLYNHLAGQSSFVKHELKGKNKLLRSGYTYQYLEVAKARNRILLEYLATAMLCPKHLLTGEFLKESK